MNLESHGVPAVLVHTETFDSLTRAALEFANYGDVPRVVLPRTLDNMDDDEVRGIAEAYADEIIQSLTSSEHSPMPWNPTDVEDYL